MNDREESLDVHHNETNVEITQSVNAVDDSIIARLMNLLDVQNNLNHVVSFLKITFPDTLPQLPIEVYYRFYNEIGVNETAFVLWEYLLDNSSNNMTNIESLDLINAFYEHLPNSINSISKLLQINENLIDDFISKEILDNIFQFANHDTADAISIIFYLTTKHNFSTKLDHEILFNIFNSMFDLQNYNISMRILKSFRNLAKKSHYNGLHMSNIIMNHMGTFMNDKSLLKAAFSSLSYCLSVDTDFVPNFSDFWQFPLDILSTDDENTISAEEDLISSICNFFESAIIEFATSFIPSTELLDKFLQLSQFKTFNIRRRSTMVIVELCKAGNIDLMKYFAANGVHIIFFEFFESANEEERVEILQSLYRICLDFDPLPDELYREIQNGMEEIEEYVDFDDQISSSLYESIRQI